MVVQCQNGEITSGLWEQQSAIMVPTNIYNNTTHKMDEHELVTKSPKLTIMSIVVIQNATQYAAFYFVAEDEPKQLQSLFKVIRVDINQKSENIHNHRIRNVWTVIFQCMKYIIGQEFRYLTLGGLEVIQIYPKVHHVHFRRNKKKKHHIQKRFFFLVFQGVKFF